MKKTLFASLLVVAGLAGAAITYDDPIIANGGIITFRGLPLALGIAGNEVDINAHLRFKDVVGSVAAGAGACGTSPAIVGNDNVGRVTVGSSTNGGVCTITFARAWGIAPVCSVENDTLVTRTAASAETTTTLTLTATTTFTAGDVLSYRCVGY